MAFSPKIIQSVEFEKNKFMQSFWERKNCCSYIWVIQKYVEKVTAQLLHRNNKFNKVT